MSYKALSNNSYIVSIKKLSVANLLSQYEHEKQKVSAQENAEYIDVYKITYISGKKKITGYIIEPKKGKNLPVVINNRGGSNEFGAWKDTQMFVGKNARLARAGYIVFLSQYSGNDGSEGVDEFGGEDVKDVLNLYAIIKTYPRADISRIGMVGGSRGGLMTYMALTQVDWVKAAVVEFGVADLLDKDKFRPDFQAHLKKMFGGKGIFLAEKKKRSALSWPEKFSPNVPILLMHGTSDWRANPMDSLRLAQQFQKLKIPYRLVMYEGADHGLSEFRQEANTEIIKWLDRYVKNGEPLPNLEPHGD